MNIKSQEGMSMLGMLCALVLVASAMLLAMKLVPLYIDDYAITKGLESLQKEENLYSNSKSAVRSKFLRKLAAEYTRPLGKDEIIIEKKKGLLVLDIIYEARVPVVYNLDIVAKFSHHFEQKK